MKQRKLKMRFFYCNTIKKLMVVLFSINLLVPVMAQDLQISGTITDEKTSEPILGASIKVLGTTTGTISDVNGKYSIKAKKSSVLEISYIGYLTQSITVADQTVIDVKLANDVKKLEEVVVIGYGVQRKEAVTGSVASMQGNALRDIPSQDITQALQGRLAGVQLDQTDSKPGSSLQIRIRGERSLIAINDPLVVLDGIPFGGYISDIDPGIIKSVEILKDASATAIYGSRGANGVILITSSKGRQGEKTSFTYNGYYGVQNVSAYYPMMNGSEFTRLRIAAGNTGLTTLDEVPYSNTNWQKLLYAPGTITSHDITCQGATSTSNYSFGAGYYYNEAVVPLQNFTRYTLRSSLDQELNKYIRIGFTTNNNYAITNGMSVGSVGTALAASPIANLYNADGTLKRTYLQATSGASWISTRSTLQALGDGYIDQTRALSTYNSVFAEVKIPGVDGLKYRMNLGLDYRQRNYGNFVGQGVMSANLLNPSTAAITNEHYLHYAVENLLTYDHRFAEKHMLNVVALFSTEESLDFTSNITALGIPNNAFQFYNMGYVDPSTGGVTTVDPTKQYYTEKGIMSYMARAMYNYNEKYMLSATIRSDGASELAPGQKWHTYPAVSAGWNIAGESFMKPITQIDQLKIRVGIGQTSNHSVPSYSTLGSLNTSPYNFGPTGNSTGYYVNTAPNPSLGWEYSETFNYGLDFSLFKHRLFGTVEYYITNTKDVELPVSLPPTSGVSSFTGNVGSTQNKGLEISLNGVILDNHDGWSWEAGINITANRNKLVSLASGETQDLINWWFVGRAIDVIYDYKKIGLWQASDKFLTNYEPSGNVGMIKVQYKGTFNPDGSPTRAIGPADMRPIDINPNYVGGFNTRVAYKNLDLNIIGTFKEGGLLNSTLYGSSSYLDNDNARSPNNVKIDYYTPTNTGAKFPQPNGIGGDNPKYGSTLGYFSASYLKVRTITLGYNFNQKFLKSTGIQKLRVYCQVTNPFVLFSPYFNQSGMDPETNSLATQNAAVPASSNLSRFLTIGMNDPETRNFLGGINLTF